MYFCTNFEISNIMAKNRQYIRQGGKKGGFRGKNKNEEVEEQYIENDELNNEEYEDDDILDLTEEIEQAQDFYEKHQNTILGIAAAIVLLLGAYFAYKYMYQEPRQAEALNAIQKAQYQFEKDSFALALENPGSGYEGFLDIIENYSGTKQANLAKYYAGVSYLNLGDYESAIKYLEDHSTTDLTKISTYGAIGDAKAELNNMDGAASAYNKAISAGSNDLLTPYYLNKLAVLSLKSGDKAAAKSSFERILKDFPKSSQFKTAQNYLARIQ